MDYPMMFVAFSIGIILSSVVFLIYRMQLVNRLELLQSQFLLDDLELATKEQLLKEFRSRPDNSYIILMPIQQDNEIGMKIELNRFTPYDSVAMLHMATSLLARQMKINGMEMPDLPKIDEMEENDQE